MTMLHFVYVYVDMYVNMLMYLMIENIEYVV